MEERARKLEKSKAVRYSVRRFRYRPRRRSRACWHSQRPEDEESKGSATTGSGKDGKDGDVGLVDAVFGAMHSGNADDIVAEYRKRRQVATLRAGAVQAELAGALAGGVALRPRRSSVVDPVVFPPASGAAPTAGNNAELLAALARRRGGT